MNNTLRQVERSLGYAFGDPALLEQALTHPSYAAESATPVPDNQRLEFLGDAVLQLVSTERLYRRFPTLNEGRLTKLRSVLTKARTLARFSRDLALHEALRVGKGEAQSGGRTRPSNLADAFESVLGAVFLDGGIAPARTLCCRLVEPYLADIDGLLATENPKGALQEYTQEHRQSKPEYQVIKVEGPEHEPVIAVRVLLDGDELARASAGNRREAERKAASKALRSLAERD